MKIILTFLFLFLFSNSYSNYTTPGTGKSWDLDSLVSFSGGNVTFSGGNYLVNDTITISASDTIKILTNSTMKFGTGVFIDINGIMIVNPPDSAKITAQDTTLKFLGLKFEDLSDGSVLKKLIMEYGNSIRMLNCDILIDSCILRYNTLVSNFASGAVSFFGSNATVSNCKIFRNRRSGLISGLTAANPSSPKILNNEIYENNINNENYPQINLGNSGSSPLIIRGNTITGLFNMAGAIGISSLLGATPNGIIENNVLKHNRYGIAILGSNATVYINNNIIDSNNIQGIPNLGGSGINFNGGATQKSVVSRNIIRGNLWGITIQGTAKPNMGDLSNSDTTDVGMNEIYNNTNSGSIFDLYNNTVDSIKAENNYWGTSNLDSIEAHIFHKPDDGSLGFVDYLPIRNIKVNITILMEGMYDPSLTILSRKDSVTVYLYDAVSPYPLRDSANAEIDSASFTGVFSFTNAPSSQYYLVADHFNCINTWSQSGGESLTANGLATGYDFTSSASQAFGNNLVLKGSEYCIYSGDVNKNSIVDLGDMSQIDNDAFNLLTGVRLPSDLNGDNYVDINDLSIGDNNTFNFVAVIRP